MDTAAIPLTLDDDGRTGALREWLKTIGVGLASAAFVFLSVIGWLTLENTYGIAQDTKATVTGHNSELHQLKVDENVVVRAGDYLADTQYTICTGLHLPCPPPPHNSSSRTPHRTRSAG